MSIIKSVERNYSSMLARNVSERIIEVKNDHKKEYAYMTLDELIQDEKYESFEEGMAKGMEKGKAEGLAEGVEKGKSEGVAEVLNLLGISKEEYQQRLKENKAGL